MPELEPLATVQELAAWMQVDVSALPASAPLVLSTASAIVRAEARQRFTRGTTTVTLYPSRGRVSLPQRPVLSVTGVTVRGQALSPSQWRLRRDTLYVRGCDEVTVTYTHGYASVPGDVKAVILSAAARVLNNPQDLRQEVAGGLSVTYAAETIGASLAPADRDLLARYRRRASVVSVE